MRLVETSREAYSGPCLGRLCLFSDGWVLPPSLVGYVPMLIVTQVKWVMDLCV